MTGPDMDLTLSAIEHYQRHLTSLLADQRILREDTARTQSMIDDLARIAAQLVESGGWALPAPRPAASDQDECVSPQQMRVDMARLGIGTVL